MASYVESDGSLHASCLFLEEAGQAWMIAEMSVAIDGLGAITRSFMLREASANTVLSLSGPILGAVGRSQASGTHDHDAAGRRVRSTASINGETLKAICRQLSLIIDGMLGVSLTEEGLLSASGTR